jgi:hypothetical protein
MSARRSLALACALAPTLTACNLFTVPFEVDLTIRPSKPVSFKLGPFSTECDDPKTRVEDAEGWHEYEDHVEGAACVVHVTGEMPALDMNDIKAEIDAQITDIGKSPADVTVTIDSTTLSFDDITLVDGSGASIAVPQLDSWSTSFQFQGDELASFSGADTNTLLAAATSFELTDAQVAALNDLLIDPGPVTIAGDADMSLDFENEFKPKLATVDAPTLQFDFEVELHASGKASIF